MLNAMLCCSAGSGLGLVSSRIDQRVCPLGKVGGQALNTAAKDDHVWQAVVGLSVLAATRPVPPRVNVRSSNPDPPRQRATSACQDQSSFFRGVWVLARAPASRRSAAVAAPSSRGRTSRGARPPEPTRLMSTIFEWFYAVPPITRSYVTAAILVTASCSLELISPFSLYFNLRLVCFKLQVWRLL